MARLRSGDEDAARHVFQCFVARLVGLARERLGRDLRRRVDPEEVVQSAYKGVFLRYGAGKLEVRDWSRLWSLLTVITLRKCVDRVDYHRAQC
jgi:RNA polymerase sigma-70 factor (ECF subfamily)